MGTHTSRITRSGDLTVAATFNWAVSAGTGTNPVNAADFPGGVFPSGTATVPANATYVDVSFTSNPDTTVEADETGLFTVTSSQTGVTVAASPQAFTITNDDSSGGGGGPTIVYGPTLTMDTGIVEATKMHRVQTTYSPTRLITMRVNVVDASNYDELRQASGTALNLSQWVNGSRVGSEMPVNNDNAEPADGATVSIEQRTATAGSDPYELYIVYGASTYVYRAPRLGAGTKAQGLISYAGDNTGRNFTITAL